MPARELATAQARLERLLYVLPAAASAADGVPITELAEALAVPPALLLDDLQEATARAYYQPAGANEDFSILVEGDRVTVFAAHEFQRPVRLSPRESVALELGLRALAAETTGAHRQRLRELAERLGHSLTAPAATTVQDQRAGGSGAEPELEAADALELAFGDDGFRSVVAEALERGRLCTLIYLKPGAAAPSERRVAPHRLVCADGRWYLVAHDLERAECRIFRLDRTLDVRLEADAPTGVPAVDVAALLRHGVPYQAHEDTEVIVRYSPRVARWVAEQVEAECLPDGSARVRHHVADPRWIVRHVLQYGGEAVIEGPAEARAWVRQAARRQAS